MANPMTVKPQNTDARPTIGPVMMFHCMKVRTEKRAMLLAALPDPLKWKTFHRRASVLMAGG